jgi:phosphatidylglycerophosphate synthase
MGASVAMVNSRNFRVALVVLTASALITSLAVVRAGLHQDWERMSILFFGTALTFLFLTMSLLGLKIDTRFRHMEKIAKEKPDPGHPDTTKPSSQRGTHDPNRVLAKAVGIIMVISVPVLLSLAIIAGLHEKWFGLGAYLLACAVSAVTCMSVAMGLAIDVRAARAEELVSGDNEG